MLGVVGGYVIESKLAEGGMGAVYRAYHQLLGRPAAVKILLPDFSRKTDIINRFFNEARAATAVRHPGIVEIYDFGYMPSGDAYIVMELLDGEPLSRWIASRGRLDEATAVYIARGIASALAAAHGQGIVHRDLKPDNIFLVPDPEMPTGMRAKLLDFGIAKVHESSYAGEATKTRTGSVMGTPTYMSPEQCRGAGSVDHRSDLYSLGCILFEMLTGRVPFVAEGVGELLGLHQFMPATPPSHVVAGISQRLDSIVMSLLAKDPNTRVQSAVDLMRMLGSTSSPQVGSAGPITVAQSWRPLPTTLGNSVGQATPTTKPKSRGALLAMVGLLAIGGGIATGVTLYGRATGETGGPAAAPAAAPAPETALTPPASAPETAPTTAPAATASPSTTATAPVSTTAPPSAPATATPSSASATAIPATTPPSTAAAVTSVVKTSGSTTPASRERRRTSRPKTEPKTLPPSTGSASTTTSTAPPRVDRGD